MDVTANDNDLHQIKLQLTWKFVLDVDQLTVEFCVVTIATNKWLSGQLKSEKNKL